MRSCWDSLKSGSRGNGEYFRELLVYDYYLRENAKSRPGFAGEETVPAGEARAFYEREEKERTLPACL